VVNLLGFNLVDKKTIKAKKNLNVVAKNIDDQKRYTFFLV